MKTVTAWTAILASVLFGAAALAADGTAAPAGAANAQSGVTGNAAQVDSSNPAKLIQTAAQTLLQQLDAHRAEYRKDHNGLYQLVDQVLLPHFDVDYSARLVLGRHWTAASPQQRQQFIQAFYKSMLTNYGDALLDFTGNQLKVLPWNGDASAQYATVRTQVRKDDGSTVAVNYGLHRTADGWKVWDVVIEGISYVKSFRDDFGEQIDQQGLDAVIQRLQSGAKPTAIGNAGKTGS